jgi:hypothetical protein
MKKIIFTLSIMLPAAFAGTAQSIWYVDATAYAGNGGASWNDAFDNLQTAINAANNGDDIWVRGDTAGMVYHPSPVSNFFNLNEKNLSIYGGFEGWETYLGERTQWKTYKSIISDLSSAHVINLNGSNAVFDGFIVENNGPDHCVFVLGGTSTQVLSNLIIRNNHSGYEGIFLCEGADPYNSVIYLINSQITCNTYESSSTLFNCLNVSMQFYNVTVANNSNPANPLTGFIVENSDISFYNSIVWENGEISIVITDWNPSFIYSYNSLIQYGYSYPYYFFDGTIYDMGGNIDDDPIFSVPYCPSGNYHLNANSSCIDAGYSFYYDNIMGLIPVIPPFYERDLDTYSRFAGGEIDMGAYEYGSEPFEAPHSFIPKGNRTKKPFEKVGIYPTVVEAGGEIWIDMGAEKTTRNKNYTVQIYSLSGICLSSETINAERTSVRGPAGPAVYVLTVEAEGQAPHHEKIIVTP